MTFQEATPTQPRTSLRNVTGEDLFTYLSPNGRSLRLALDRHFHYALHPEQWPYVLPGGLEGKLWQLLHPCADQVELPAVYGWPGPLFEIASDIYQEPKWKSWVEPARPLMGSDAWVNVTLTRQSP